MTTVRQLTIGLLRELGLTTVFGNPGSTELPLFRDFPADFRYILGLHEGGVLAMADGYAQAVRNAAFINLHSSAGTGNALGTLFTAFRNQTPLIVTAGQQARSILPYDPFLHAERPTEFPRPFIKWACEPARAQDVPAAIARAYHMALEPPCGPTFVSVPIDDWDAPCEAFVPRRVYSERRGSPESLARCAEALARATSPCLVVGAGVARDRAWDAVIDLAERHQAPVWAAPMSCRNSFPEDHRLFAGFLGASREQIVSALGGHDLVLGLGGPVSLYHVEGSGPHIRAGTDIWLVSDNPAHACSAPTGTAIISTTRGAVEALLAGPTPPQRMSPRPRPLPPRLSDESMTDAYVCQQIAALRPSESIIVEEAPSSRSAMHDYLPITGEDTFYTMASGGLGYGLPAAIGVALARPSEKVIALLGDGSSMYAIQALLTAAQHRLPISFVILKNGRYEALHHFGRLFGIDQPIGTTFPELDFCGLANAQGVPARRAANAASLDSALDWSFRCDGPSLVETVIE
jgi:benzoylformate decarboxylase